MAVKGRVHWAKKSEGGEKHDRQRRHAVDGGGGSALAEYITGGNVLLSLIINFCTSFCECPAPPHPTLPSPPFPLNNLRLCRVLSGRFCFVCVCVCVVRVCVVDGKGQGNKTPPLATKRTDETSI